MIRRLLRLVAQILACAYWTRSLCVGRHQLHWLPNQYPYTWLPGEKRLVFGKIYSPKANHVAPEYVRTAPRLVTTGHSVGQRFIKGPLFRLQTATTGESEAHKSRIRTIHAVYKITYHLKADCIPLRWPPSPETQSGACVGRLQPWCVHP